jgi:hypothetical protein
MMNLASEILLGNKKLYAGKKILKLGPAINLAAFALAP